MADLEYHFTKISYWNRTTCIRSNNLDLIEQTLTHIFQQEGYHRIFQPPLPQNSQAIIQELLACPWKMEPYLWVISLAVGNFGWTIIKTSVEEALCRRAKGTIRPRLSELAMQTGCDVFHNSVHDRHWGVLLEANAFGQTLATGYLNEFDDVENMQFHDESVIEPKERRNFFLLNVPEEFQAAGRVEVHLSEEEKQRREEELEALVQKQPEQSGRALTQWRELNMSSFERTDENLGQLLCGSNSSSYYQNDYNIWHENNLLYTAYAEPQQFEAQGVRLLFFQMGGFDRRSDTEEIWEPIIHFNRLKYAADIRQVNLGTRQEERLWDT